MITPVPKQHPPAGVSDYRPISILPMFSTIFQKILVRRYIYIMLTVSPLADSMSDQFAFRPTGSTAAAVISLLHETPSLLADNAYYVRHCTLFEKLASLLMPDNAIN